MNGGVAHGGLLISIVRFGIRFRGVTIALAVAMIVYGVYAIQHARYNVFPEFAPPQVAIQTEAPGLSPEQVELIVTQPIENAVNGVSGIEALRSTSIQGLSVVTVVFNPSSEIYHDRQVVAERLASVARQLPQTVAPPEMTPLTTSTSLTLVVGLTSDRRSLMDVRTAADWIVRPRLLGVPGVAKVTVFGGDVRQLQVQLRPDDLLRWKIGINDVLAAARRAAGVRGAGFIETSNQRIVLQTTGSAVTPEDIAETVLFDRGDGLVKIRHVADVVEAPEPPIGGATVMGRPGVLIEVGQQYGGDTLDLTGRVDRALDDLRPALEAEQITLRSDIFRPATFIVTATSNVQRALVIGGVMVIVVLVVFLYDWRTAAISCTAIPLSLIGAVIVLRQLSISLDTMTLGGLAIAIGEVVDDAVIDVENIARRLRENHRSTSPRPIARVVLDASLEVRSAVVYATFAVIFVFVPVLTLSGVAGKLFAPLGLAYIFAVLTSLLVALAVTPALAMALLGRHPPRLHEPPVTEWAGRRYRGLLTRVERHTGLTLMVVTVLLVGTLTLVPFFGASFIPELKEGHFILHVSAVPGTSLAESIRSGQRLTDALTKLPSVRVVAQQIGRAEKAEDTWGQHYSEFHIDLRPLDANASEQAEADIRKTVDAFPGINYSMETFLTERIEEVLSGYTAAVAVNIFGSDLDALDRQARDAARVLRGITGGTDVQVQSPPGMPQLGIQLRAPDVARWGLSPVDVLDAVQTAYQGEEVGQVYDRNRVFPIAVILSPTARRDPAAVGDLLIRNDGGTYLKLRQVATVGEAPGRYQVSHIGARRVQTVTANVSGRDVASFVADARRQIASRMSLPGGTYVEFAGTAEAQAQSQRDLIFDSLFAGLGVILLVSIVTRHWRNLALVLLNLPFALVGGVLAVAAMGGTLSLGSLVGFVTLFGITLRNSILMISHFEHLVAVDGQPWNVETALQGAADRLAPIVMTSLVTALGLLPLAIGMRAPGREIEGPMALVILGGLATSMVLNLLVLPTLALHYGRFDRPADDGLHA